MEPNEDNQERWTVPNQGATRYKDIYDTAGNLICRVFKSEYAEEIAKLPAMKAELAYLGAGKLQEITEENEKLKLRLSSIEATYQHLQRQASAEHVNQATGALQVASEIVANLSPEEIRQIMPECEEEKCAPFIIAGAIAKVAVKINAQLRMSLRAEIKTREETKNEVS